MSEREEYTAENYPSFGKKYNGEKAIISLTSWKARINTVSKTLFSLLKQCPGFHIVLVLSEEEFPQKEKELPENLMVFVENELIELLWVYKNYKSLKKILFTMDKYKTIPVISADDDCIYICNYAEIMYNKWKENPNSVIKYKYHEGYNGTQGPSTFYPPFVFNILLEQFKNNLKQNIAKYQGLDDAFLSDTIINAGIKIIPCSNHYCFRFHNENGAIHPNLNQLKIYEECYSSSLEF